MLVLLFKLEFHNFCIIDAHKPSYTLGSPYFACFLSLRFVSLASCFCKFVINIIHLVYFLFSIFLRSSVRVCVWLTVKEFAAQWERTKKAVKYTDSLMLEAREMKEESGFIYLRVLLQWYSVLPLASKLVFLSPHLDTICRWYWCFTALLWHYPLSTMLS